MKLACALFWRENVIFTVNNNFIFSTNTSHSSECQLYPPNQTYKLSYSPLLIETNVLILFTQGSQAKFQLVFIVSIEYLNKMPVFDTCIITTLNYFKCRLSYFRTLSNIQIFIGLTILNSDYPEGQRVAIFSINEIYIYFHNSQKSVHL